MEYDCPFLNGNDSINMSESTHASKLIVDTFLDESSRSIASASFRSKSPPINSISSTNNSRQRLFEPMRERVNTEETHRIQNKIEIPSPNTSTNGQHDQELNYISQDMDKNYNNYNLNSSNQAQERNFECEDDYSIISSLTQDEDSYHYRERSSFLSPLWEEIPSPLNAITPPSIVEVSMSHSYMKSKYDDSSLESLMARHGIRENNIELRQPVSSCCNSLSSSARLSKQTVHSILQDSWTSPSTISRRSTLSFEEISPYSKYMGNRKRRVSHKGYTGAEISLGSIVGQSTLLTSSSCRTVTPSVTSSEASSFRRALRSSHEVEDLLLNVTGADEGIGCCQVHRPKNIIKEEFKYVAGKLLQKSPLRKLPFFHGEKVEFQRAKGSLV
jgi:hypothetical protein